MKNLYIVLFYFITFQSYAVDLRFEKWMSESIPRNTFYYKGEQIFTDAKEGGYVFAYFEELAGNVDNPELVFYFSGHDGVHIFESGNLDKYLGLLPDGLLGYVMLKNLNSTRLIRAKEGLEQNGKNTIFKQWTEEALISTEGINISKKNVGKERDDVDKDIFDDVFNQQNKQTRTETKFLIGNIEPKDIIKSQIFFLTLEEFLTGSRKWKIYNRSEWTEFNNHPVLKSDTVPEEEWGKIQDTSKSLKLDVAMDLLNQKKYLNAFSGLVQVKSEKIERNKDERTQKPERVNQSDKKNDHIRKEKPLKSKHDTLKNAQKNKWNWLIWLFWVLLLIILMKISIHLLKKYQNK